jgi:hypothetical protein
VRAQMPDADPDGLCLLDNLLGIADPNVEVPTVDPDDRQRRLSALINSVQLARNRSALLVVEDVHWIDEVSESMLAGFFAAGSRLHPMVLLTYRPEYRGVLRHVDGAQTIALEPLSPTETSRLIDELMGTNPSVGELGLMIGARAAGNPFFAEEIVRDLAGRGILTGHRGRYICTTDIGTVRVPETLEASLTARIDRLTPAAKKTLCTAAVAGSRFSSDLLESLDINAGVEELIAAEFIEQVALTPQAEYAFRHPLIRAVAYESQLTADRAHMHRRLAVAIEDQERDAADQNAALIAEHLEAAGDYGAAYSWHMRAAAWAINRDTAAARLGWERAIRIADSMPVDHPARTAMRIASRTMLCGMVGQVRRDVDRFEELRQLCAAAGDMLCLFVAVTGLVMDRVHRGQIRAGSQLASETMALISSPNDATLAGPGTAARVCVDDGDQWSAALRWSQLVVGLTDDDLTKGAVAMGSPFALALAKRANARFWLGRSGWREDIDRSLLIGRNADPASYAAVVSRTYLPAIAAGVLKANDRALYEIEHSLRTAEQSGDKIAADLARITLGVALLHRSADKDRARGAQLLRLVEDNVRPAEYPMWEPLIASAYQAWYSARSGDHDVALPIMREAIDRLAREGQLVSWGAPATGVLVQTLLDRDADGDVSEAATAIERLADAPADEDLAARNIWVVGLRTLLARARGDTATYHHLRGQYLTTAKSLDFEGHIAWADAMP